MKLLKLYPYMFSLVFVILTASCNSEPPNTDKQEVKAMDSLSTELEKTNKDLDEQAKKVEASLEKIDKEFNTSK